MNMRSGPFAVVMMVLLGSCRPDPRSDESGRTLPQAESPVPKIRESIARPANSFVAETTLVALIERSLAEWQGDVETRAELELLRLRALRRVAQLPEVAAFNPYASSGAPDPPPGLREWTKARARDLTFSELGMSWFVSTDVFWTLHDHFPSSRVSDEIAWEAAQAGLGGECEGYAGCYLAALLQMSGRYVETHPAGQHRAEALEIVRSQLVQMDELEPTRPLCGEEADTQGVRPEDLQRMRRVLETAAAIDTAKSGAALAALERLEQRCR